MKESVVLHSPSIVLGFSWLHLTWPLLPVWELLWCLESENESFSSFGTLEADPIIDALLRGDAPMIFCTSEEQKAKITSLQNELFQLEKDKVIEEKVNNDSMMQGKEIKETSRMAKYVFGKIGDLDATELCEMYLELSKIKKDINNRLSGWD